MVTFLQLFPRHLFRFGQHGLRPADGQRGGAGARINPLDHGADQFLMLAFKFLKQPAAFAVTDTLPDDVPRRLRGDAPKILGVEGNGDDIAQTRGRIDFARLCQRDFLSLFRYVLNDGLAQVNFKVFFRRIHVYHAVLVAIAVLAGGDDRFFDPIYHKIGRNAALLFQQIKGVKNFAVHVDSYSFNSSSSSRRTQAVSRRGTAAVSPESAFRRT